MCTGEQKKKTVIKYPVCFAFHPVCRSASPLCTRQQIYYLLKAGILNLFSAWSLWSHLPSSHSEPLQQIHGFIEIFVSTLLENKTTCCSILPLLNNTLQSWKTPSVCHKEQISTNFESNMWPMKPYVWEVIQQNTLEHCKNKDSLDRLRQLYECKYPKITLQEFIL